MQYVAFLRAINSGANPSQKMEVLKKIFADLGFNNVKTVIASGNVLFQTGETDRKALEEKIENALEKFTGIRSETILKTKEEIERLVTLNPFKNYEIKSGSKPHVSFVKEGTKSNLQFPFENKGYKVLGNFNGAICSIVELNTGSTPNLMAVLDREYNKQITTRTWETVNRVLKKF